MRYIRKETVYVYFPDAIHKEHFGGPVLKAGETYDTMTVYKFE